MFLGWREREQNLNRKWDLTRGRPSWLKEDCFPKTANSLSYGSALLGRACYSALSIESCCSTTTDSTNTTLHYYKLSRLSRFACKKSHGLSWNSHQNCRFGVHLKLLTGQTIDVQSYAMFNNPQDSQIVRLSGFPTCCVAEWEDTIHCAVMQHSQSSICEVEGVPKMSGKRIVPGRFHCFMWGFCRCFVGTRHTT